jgi:FkbM family methyltransferase
LHPRVVFTFRLGFRRVGFVLAPEPGRPHPFGRWTKEGDRGSFPGLNTQPPTVTPPPWGAYRPDALSGFLVALVRAVPKWPLVKQAAFPLRRLARRRLAGPVDAELWGHRLRFQARGNISEARLLFLPDRWDREERAVLVRHARPGMVFVDVGSNFGGYTWWVLSLLGEDCRIVALEPDPELNARLRFNLETIGCRNVTVLPYAAGERHGLATLSIHETNRGENRLLDVDAADGSRGVEVPVRTLKEVLEETGTERVDVLKIDIEGLEPQVLRAFFQDSDPSLWPRLLFSERKDTPEHAELERDLLTKGYVLEARTRLNMVLRRGEG